MPNTSNAQKCKRHHGEKKYDHPRYESRHSKPSSDFVLTQSKKDVQIIVHACDSKANLCRLIFGFKENMLLYGSLKIFSSLVPNWLGLTLSEPFSQILSCLKRLLSKSLYRTTCKNTSNWHPASQEHFICIQEFISDTSMMFTNSNIKAFTFSFLRVQMLQALQFHFQEILSYKDENSFVSCI